MTIRIDDVPVALPGLRVFRWSSDERYVGVKESYAIARVEAGCSEWWTAGRRRRSVPGSLQLKQPGDVHREVQPGKVVIQVVSLPARSVEAVVGTVHVTPQLDAGDARGAAFERLHRAIDRGENRLALEVAVTEAIAAIGRVGQNRCDCSPPVRRARELLRARLAEALTLDELAAHAGLDKFHLCRAFRTQVGLPPHAYLTRLRIVRAKELLVAGVPPKQVASQVGLYDQSQLNRHFRRIVGVTPGEFARAAR